MSEEIKSQMPAVSVANPLPIETTPAIERANRLLSITNHPGFVDIIKISLDLAKQTSDLCVKSTAWDPMQITALKCQAHGAITHHEMLFQTIAEAIAKGIQDQRTLIEMNPKALSRFDQEHDYVRQKATEQRLDFDNRVAGSYLPGE